MIPIENLIVLILIIGLIFFTGWLIGFVTNPWIANNIEQPFTLMYNPVKSQERFSPGDWISEDKIHVYNDRVIIELAGIQDSERARGLLQSTALLELMIVRDVESTNTIIRQIDNLSSSENQVGNKSQNDNATNVGDLFSSDNEVNDLQYEVHLIDYRYLARYTGRDHKGYHDNSDNRYTRFDKLRNRKS